MEEKRTGRILVVEDRPRWQEALSENLQRAGYTVDTVSSSAQAREYLQTKFYHLIILDIRLDETDQTNTEGMSLLDELNTLLGTSVAIIMLSGYGTKDQMREAFRHFKVTDFLEKQHFDNVKFRQQVQHIFTQEIPINLNLKVYWDNGYRFKDVVLNLKINQHRVEADTPLQARMAIELDDLLCRLFHNAENLIIKPLRPGYSGAGVLWIQPFFKDGGGQAVIVKFGDVRKIDEEYRNFQIHVQSFVGGGRHTAALNLQRTARLGGITYSLLGAKGDQQHFGDFYRHASIPEIKSVINNLFRGTCGAWYANPSKLQPQYLNAEYEKLMGFTLERLKQIIHNDLKSVEVTDRLYFKPLNSERSFKDPIATLMGKHLVRPTYICTTHGDLNSNNILVDQVGQVWLIDFQHTKPSHILRDVANLDAVVRFQLLQAGEASLAERLAMEENLSRIRRFSQLDQLAADFTTDNPALAKAFAVSLHLRQIARQLVAPNPSDDFSEYHIAALYQAFYHVRLSTLMPEQREHALLSASLVVEQLDL
ncbi:MAG: response regulator [Anaerolineaceae bacterium]|nr:response regulator [Anaerolineaceae bacterium]